MAILGEFQAYTRFELLASKPSVLANHPAFPRKKSNIARPIKDQNVVLLGDEEYILDR